MSGVREEVTRGGSRLERYVTVGLIYVTIILGWQFGLLFWQKSATLRSLEARSSLSVAGVLLDVTFLRYFKRNLTFVAGLLASLVVTYAILIAISTKVNDPNFRWRVFLASALILVMIFACGACYVAIRRYSVPVDIKESLLKLIMFVERRPKRWQALEVRRSIIRRLEKTALLYEALGLEVFGKGPIPGFDPVEWSRGVAAALREVKLWIFRPNDFTFTDVLNRLSQDLLMLHENRLQDLPSVDPGSAPVPSVSRRGSRVAWGLFSLVLLAAAAYLLYDSRRLGAAAPLAVSALGALGLLALERAGLPLADLVRARGALDGLRRAPKSSDQLEADVDKGGSKGTAV